VSNIERPVKTVVITSSFHGGTIYIYFLDNGTFKSYRLRESTHDVESLLILKAIV
jgi:hypothetical protein